MCVNVKQTDVKVCPECGHGPEQHQCGEPWCLADGCGGCGWCPEEIEIYGEPTEEQHR